MKPLDGLWAEMTSFGNLYAAWRKARRGKAANAEVAAFELDLEGRLLGLSRSLRDGSYSPGSYRLFTVYERKPREIAAAPLVDRVVHHALLNLIEPTLDRHFIHDSWACRKGRGVHRAVDRYQRWAHRYAYALQMDIRWYFPSIDHCLLKEKLRRRVADEKVLWLLDLIIDHSPPFSADKRPVFPADDLLTPLERPAGIPIGNLTSQFFANLYLDDLDHYVKEILKMPAYLRYVDDMVLLDDDKSRLWWAREEIRAFLENERLLLHPAKSQTTPVGQGIDLLGYRVFPDRRRLRNDNGHRFARRLRKMARAYARGRLNWDDIDPSVQSWIGHARHADTEGLRKEMFRNIVFSRAIS